MIGRMKTLLFVLLLATGSNSALAATDPECVKLKTQLPTMKPEDALIALDRFAATAENPEGCPNTDIQSWTGSAEQKLVRLIDDAGSLAPQMTLRCNKFSRKNTHCQGLEADDTLLITDQWFPRLRSLKGTSISIESAIPDSEVVALYKAKISALRNGQPATAIPIKAGKYSLSGVDKDSIVVAIIRTKGLWANWKYRKAVWFF